MLSLAELRRAADAIARRLAGHRVRSAAQPDDTSVVLGTWGEGGKRLLLLSARPGSARASLLAQAPPAPPTPPAFAQYLRAHVVGGRLAGARVLDDDRQLALRIETREGAFDLVLSILGPRSNVYALDRAGLLVAALRPLGDTRSELALGAPWHSPASKPPGAGADRFEGVPEERLLEAIETYYASSEQHDRIDALRRRVGQALARQQKLLDRRLAQLEAELGEARAAGELERRGELLKGALSRVRRGDREVVARDYASGEEVAIPLDPQKSPAENLEALFKRYRKAVRTLTKAGAQEEQVRADRAALGALRADFEALGEDSAALERFAERPEVAALLGRLERRRQPPPARRRETEVVLAGRVVPGRLVPRRYRTAGELEVWVGRSDAGNDHLSTRLARGKDLFFHLDGAPGSHVILRTGGRSDPPSEAVLDACELAVHFSKAKKASRADVHVVPVKNVRKPKGAKPGLVTVHGGKTVHLRRTPARLERVLAARIEDGDGSNA